ncbi:hypothetical protein OKW30_003492 [Paraburkholderia sp. Clong3]|uniref:hypothetical protein n=1 Tax=Paraburkholderia sp. Clong3 TaxID=2991061 RepID=UPI003D21AC88
MNWANLVSTLAAAGLTGAALAAIVSWLIKRSVEHQFNIRLEKFRISLQAESARERAEVDASIKITVETALAESAAGRNYEWEARKRLYTVVSPLHFQLLLACRDLAARINEHGIHPTYAMQMGSYYGQSTLYRILRPLAICELVERQITVADFSVDSIGMEILRFYKASMSIFSGAHVVGQHPKAIWDRQEEHIFYHSISSAVDHLIVSDRCMRFSEFENLLLSGDLADNLHPFPEILESFSVDKKPIFWVRLISYAVLCANFVNKHGDNEKLQFAPRHIETRRLLEQSNDEYIRNELTKFVQRCDDVTSFKL